MVVGEQHPDHRSTPGNRALTAAPPADAGPACKVPPSSLIMSLLNVPIAFDDGGAGIPRPLAYLATLLGVLGIAGAVALFANVSWAPAAVVAVGVLNLIGAVVALVRGGEGGVIGLVLSLIIVGLGVATMRSPGRRAPQTA
jgi:hypothetical protein